jgi:MraZ protein
MKQAMIQNDLMSGGTPSFGGRYAHSLDLKRRLTIPIEWREVLGPQKTLCVLPDFCERCLRVFPLREMSRRLEVLRKSSLLDTRARQFVREIAGRMQQISWDAQGRIRLADALLAHAGFDLAHAGLDMEVVLIGAADTFEIWSTKHAPHEAAEFDLGRYREAGEYMEAPQDPHGGGTL